MKKLLLLFLFILTGCSKEINIITKNGSNKIFISYPTTNINKIDRIIKNYIKETTDDFKSLTNSELNIDFIFNEFDDYISIKLYSIINNNKNNLLTINYYKKEKRILSLKEFINIDSDCEHFYFDHEYIYLIYNTEEIKYNLSNYNIFLNKNDETNDIKSIQTTKIDTTKPMIAITFDDGPSKYTRKIIDLLNEYDSKGTFFVLGNKVNFYNGTIKYISQYGHEIGNHSYSHRWLTRIDDDELEYQIEETQKLIFKYTNTYPKLLRPTYGAINKNLSKRTNLKIILWDLDSNDWKLKSNKKISKNILKNVKDKDIILFHDTYEWTYKALKIIIPKLIDNGYQLVNVSNLIYVKDLNL